MRKKIIAGKSKDNFRSCSAKNNYNRPIWTCRQQRHEEARCRYSCTHRWVSGSGSRPLASLCGEPGSLVWFSVSPKGSHAETWSPRSHLERQPPLEVINGSIMECVTFCCMSYTRMRLVPTHSGYLFCYKISHMLSYPVMWPITKPSSKAEQMGLPGFGPLDSKTMK